MGELTVCSSILFFFVLFVVQLLFPGSYGHEIQTCSYNWVICLFLSGFETPIADRMSVCSAVMDETPSMVLSSGNFARRC